MAKDSGSSSGGDSSTSCTIPADWSQNSNGPACDACELKNCCAAINACENDSTCLAIFNCQNNCYSGDAGPPDDSGATSADTCAAACVTGADASTSSQDHFTAQDNCVNGTACGSATVCN